MPPGLTPLSHGSSYNCLTPGSNCQLLVDDLNHLLSPAPTSLDSQHAVVECPHELAGGTKRAARLRRYELPAMLDQGTGD